MTWRELLQFLHTLETNKDKRLDDTLIIYDSTRGEYYPADIVEFNDCNDEFIDNNQLFLMMFDWNGISEIKRSETP